jgi:hypothetical protein
MCQLAEPVFSGCHPGEDLGYYVDFRPGPNKHTLRAALRSKFSIMNSTGSNVIDGCMSAQDCFGAV